MVIPALHFLLSHNIDVNARLGEVPQTRALLSHSRIHFSISAAFALQ